MRVVQSWSFCADMESLKLLFLSLGLLLRKAAEHISTPISTGECKCPHSAGACTDGRGWRTQGVSDHPCEFPEWLCQLHNGAASSMNGQQALKQPWQMSSNGDFLPQLYFCSVTQNDYLQGKSIWKAFQLYFRKADHSERNKVSIFNFFWWKFGNASLGAFFFFL